MIAPYYAIVDASVQETYLGTVNRLKGSLANLAYITYYFGWQSQVSTPLAGVDATKICGT